MELKTNTQDRKALVKAVAEITGAEAKYDGPPSFSYTVDYFTIGRDSVISFDDRADSEEVENLIEGLAQRGFIDRADEVDELEISVPIDTADMNALKNLVFTLHAKQYLLNRVTRRDTFAVSDSLVEALETNPPSDYEAFCAALSADTGDMTGIVFGEDKVTFTFPVSENPNKNRAYAELSLSWWRGQKKQRGFRDRTETRQRKVLPSHLAPAFGLDGRRRQGVEESIARGTSRPHGVQNAR